MSRLIWNKADQSDTTHSGTRTTRSGMSQKWFETSCVPDVVDRRLGKSMRYLGINGLKRAELHGRIELPRWIGSWGRLKILNGIFTPFLQLFQLLYLQFNNNGRLRLSTTPSRLVCITILVHTINTNRFTASASRQSEHRKLLPCLEPTSILSHRKNAQYSGSLSKSWSKMSTSRSPSPLIFSEHTARWLSRHKIRQIV